MQGICRATDRGFRESHADLGEDLRRLVLEPAETLEDSGLFTSFVSGDASLCTGISILASGSQDTDYGYQKMMCFKTPFDYTTLQKVNGGP